MRGVEWLIQTAPDLLTLIIIKQTYGVRFLQYRMD